MGDKSELTPFLELLKKQNRVSVIFGAVFVAFGGLLYLIPADETKDWIIKLVIMAFFIVMGGVFIAMGIRSPRKAPFIQALRDTPELICWIYVQRNMRAGRHVASVLTLGLVTGKLLQIGIGLGNDEKLSALAASYAPEARRGYSKELQIEFRLDPEAMRREA